MLVARRSERAQVSHPHKYYNTPIGRLFPDPAIFCDFYLSFGIGKKARSCVLLLVKRIRRGMMNTRGFTNSSQSDALVRVAAFSAALRGHWLTGWVQSADSAAAVCAKCNSSVTVHRSLFEPTMDGPALEVECRAEVHRKAA
jgi:hypothetical protein